MGQGRFEGVSDKEWGVIKDFLPSNEGYVGKKGGKPPQDFRKIFNTILWVNITGAAWCHVPKGAQFAPRSTAHRWLKRWAEDGTWEGLAGHVVAAAGLNRLIDWRKAFIDGSFFPGQGRRRW